MRINEMNKEQMASLLNELFGLKGAKEVFERHNIEMVNKETETMGVKALIKAVKDLLANSKAVKEYNQAVQFLDMQISTNEMALKNAEGFMKTMVEGMLSSFKASKELAVTNQSGQFAQETKELVSNIVNEEDRKAVAKHLSTMRLDKVDEVLATIEKEVETSINSRYTDEEKPKKEVKKAVKEVKKEEPKVDVDDEFTGLEESAKALEEPAPAVVEQPKEEPVVEDSKVEKVSKPVEEDMDLSDFDDIKEAKEEAKEVKEDNEDWLADLDDEEMGDLGDLGAVDLDNPFI